MFFDRQYHSCRVCIRLQKTSSLAQGSLQSGLPFSISYPHTFAKRQWWGRRGARLVQLIPRLLVYCQLKRERTHRPCVPTYIQTDLNVGDIDNQRLTYRVPISAILACNMAHITTQSQPFHRAKVPILYNSLIISTYEIEKRKRVTIWLLLKFPGLP